MRRPLIQLQSTSTRGKPLLRGRVIPRLLAWTCLITGLASLAGAAQDKPADGGEAQSGPVTIPASRQANKVAILTIEGEITSLTERSISRRVTEARKWGADAIVLDLNTPGGAVGPTLDIAALLKDASETPPNTVGWIHPNAYSGGTIIALACREIVVAPNASFGDAAPIQVIPLMGLRQLPAAERAKIEAPLLAEVIDSARRNGYDENLVQAFISVGIELWMLENTGTGERVFVTGDEYGAVFGEAPPAQIPSVTPPTNLRDLPGVQPYFDPFASSAPPDEAMSEEDIHRAIEASQDRPPARTPLTESDRADWRLVGQVISNDRLLTLKASGAIYYGLAASVIANDEELKAHFGAQELRRFDQSWSESLAGFISSPIVMAILIVIFLVCLFIELAAPGLGVFGAAALAALLLLVGAPTIAGMAQWWEILLIAGGIILITVEIFVIPGFGVAGVSGALCLLAGLVGLFVSNDLSSPSGQAELGTGIVSVLAALFGAGVGMWLISRHFHSLPLFDQLILKSELGSARPRVAGASRQSVGILEAMGAATPDPVEIGQIGTAFTDLRPAGRGMFDRRLLDVQSPGRYIEKGSPIRVIAIGRLVIEVEEADG